MISIDDAKSELMGVTQKFIIKSNNEFDKDSYKEIIIAVCTLHHFLIIRQYPSSSLEEMFKNMPEIIVKTESMITTFLVAAQRILPTLYSPYIDEEVIERVNEWQEEANTDKLIEISNIIFNFKVHEKFKDFLPFGPKENRIKFSLKCLNCLSSFDRQETDYLDDEQLKSMHDTSLYLRENLLTRIIQVKLYKSKYSCENCGHAGAFSILSPKISGESAHIAIPKKWPSVNYIFTKDEEGVSVKIDVVQSGTLGIMQSFYQLIIKQIKSTPEEFFIEHDEGEATIETYCDMNDIKCRVSKFLYEGFSKKELFDISVVLKRDFFSRYVDDDID